MQLSKHSLALATVALLAAGPAHAQLALTPAGIADGFTLSTFAGGFPNSSSIGPSGIAFVNGGELVADFPGNVRFFPTDADGQSASAATIGQNYGLANAWGLAQLNGAIYLAQQLNGDVVQVNPNGTFNQVIVGGINQATGLLADTFNDSLYVSSAVYGNGTVYNVNPITKTKTPFVNDHLDGLTLSADGSILYGAGDEGADDGHVLGFSTATGAQVFDSGFIPGGTDGSALGTGSLAGNLFVNTNGGTLFEVNLATKAQTLLASGGSRGDFVTVDPNGTLLLTQTDRILRLTPKQGGGFVGGNAVPEPSDLALIGLGLPTLAGLMLRARKRQSRTA